MSARSTGSTLTIPISATTTASAVAFSAIAGPALPAIAGLGAIASDE